MARKPSTLQRRLSAFVDWLAPDPQREAEIREQAHEIRGRIRSAAHQDGLVVRSTPSAGSFEKRTSLRRHVTGGSDVEGYDVDLPFVVSPVSRRGVDTGDDNLGFLLGRFKAYAEQVYPEAKPCPTRSAIALHFTGKRRRFDLVPMLAAEHGRQILIRANGERIETSVERHVDFIRRRTTASNELSGRVKFNECVRLVKWWREFRQGDGDFRLSSFVLELLCADAFDACQVEATYAATLGRWFRHMAEAARARRPIAFRDFAPVPAPRESAAWRVLDPVSPDNNAVKRWTVWDIDRLAGWLDEAAAACDRAIEFDERGVDHESLHGLVQLFGTPVKHHCGS